jgi:preprotein translocase subunit SecA
VEIVESINKLRAPLSALSEEQLKAKSIELRCRHKEGASLHSLIPEAFALVREATFRKLGKSHYDVQLVGGIVLHNGAIAEMATGEGKSLTGILPAFLYALTGSSVFMVTVNDYLAKRDAQLFDPVFQMLGMQVRNRLTGQLWLCMVQHAVRVCATPLPATV